MINQKRISTKSVLRISQAQETDVLRKIVELTSSGLELSLILSEVVKIVNEITVCDSVFVYLVDNKEKDLVLMASKTQIGRAHV